MTKQEFKEFCHEEFTKKRVLKSEEICGIYREKVFCVGCIYKNQCQRHFM